MILYKVFEDHTGQIEKPDSRIRWEINQQIEITSEPASSRTTEPKRKSSSTPRPCISSRISFNFRVTSSRVGFFLRQYVADRPCWDHHNKICKKRPVSMRSQPTAMHTQPNECTAVSVYAFPRPTGSWSTQSPRIPGWQAGSVPAVGELVSEARKKHCCRIPPGAFETYRGLRHTQLSICQRTPCPSARTFFETWKSGHQSTTLSPGPSSYVLQGGHEVASLRWSRNNPTALSINKISQQWNNVPTPFQKSHYRPLMEAVLESNLCKLSLLPRPVCRPPRLKFIYHLAFGKGEATSMEWFVDPF